MQNEKLICKLAIKTGLACNLAVEVGRWLSLLRVTLLRFR